MLNLMRAMARDNSVLPNEPWQIPLPRVIDRGGIGRKNMASLDYEKAAVHRHPDPAT